MKERLQPLLLTALFILLPLAASMLGIFFLYLADLDEARDRVERTVQGEKDLIRVLANQHVASSREGTHPSRPAPVQLSRDQVIEALRHYAALGNSGEILLGRRDKDGVVLTFRQHAREPDKPLRVPAKSEWAKPMKKALAGESGTMRTRNYQGQDVIAAYRPLPAISRGMVATEDVAAIQAPYHRAMWITGLCGWLLGMVGAAIYLRSVSPLWEELRTRERSLRVLFSNLPGLVFRSRNDPNWTMELVSQGLYEVTGMDPAELSTDTGRAYGRLIHPEDRDRVWTEIQEAVTKNRSYETTYRIHDAQGRLRWVWERGRPVTRPGESAPHLEGFITDITAAREAAETRDRLSAVLEATPDFVAMIDPEDRTFYLNPAGRRLLGYEGEAELPGISIEDYHPRPLRKWTVEEVLPEARRKGTWQGEHVLLARDGTEIPVSGVIVAHFRDSGELDFYSAVFRDIRHLKETQEGLARERDFIDAVVENMPGLFGVITPNGKLVRWNRTLERVTGHSTESLASTWTADLFPAEQRTYLRATVQQAMEEGEASVELNLVGADGGLVPYDIECYLVTIASRPYLVGFGYDLTKRKALEAAREQLAEILEATPDYVSIVDPHGHILYLNPAAKELLGHPADQAPPPQWTAFDSHPPQEAERLLKEAFPTAREKGWWEGETKFLRHDGTEVPMAQIILTHRDPKGEVAWYSTIARDLTKHKEAEELARRRLGELAHASRLSTAGEMATQLAHELNQPLAAITAYSQACLNYFERPEPDYPMLRNILGELQNQSQRAGQIITHLRALVSRDQSRWRPVELNTLLDNVLKLVEVETAAKGARVATAYTPDLPPIHGDPVLVEQVALNLIRNAADAVAEAAENGDFEGRIEVETEPLEPNQARVSVRDNGPGLSDEDLERVFEPYYTSKPNGMGLGLRISQSIVEAHGGKLWAEHNPGGGAVFRFTLPCLQPDNGEEEEADGGNTGPM